MNEKEAKDVLEILLEANGGYGGCRFCVKVLMKLFCEKFFEFKQLAEKVFKAKFNEDLF